MVSANETPGLSTDNPSNTNSEQIDEYFNNQSAITPIHESEETSREFSTELSLEADEKRIREGAKNFEGSLEPLWNALDGIRVALVMGAARKKGWDKESLKELNKTCGASPETIELGVKSSSRIAARYCKSSEVIDWVGLTSAISTLIGGTISAIKEIKKGESPRADGSKVVTLTPGRVNV